MSKKYAPSGYQIINLDLSDKTSGTPFIPETEDEKLLHEILSTDDISKPILLRIYDNLTQKWIGFGTSLNGVISLVCGTIGSSYSLLISCSEDKLLYEYVEE